MLEAQDRIVILSLESEQTSRPTSLLVILRNYIAMILSARYEIGVSSGTSSMGMPSRRDQTLFSFAYEAPCRSVVET